jgi:hypothetical protein
MIAQERFTAIQVVVPWTLPCAHAPGIHYHWDCPRCGIHVVSPTDEAVTPEAIAADPLCWYCRRRTVTPPTASRTTL